MVSGLADGDGLRVSLPSDRSEREAEGAGADKFGSRAENPMAQWSRKPFRPMETETQRTSRRSGPATSGFPARSIRGTASNGAESEPFDARKLIDAPL
jgi:hypothetical protein